GGERRLDPLEQDFLGDILVAMDAVHDPDQIDTHATPPGRRGCQWAADATRWARTRGPRLRRRGPVPKPRPGSPGATPPRPVRCPEAPDPGPSPTGKMGRERPEKPAGLDPRACPSPADGPNA